MTDTTYLIFSGFTSSGMDQKLLLISWKLAKGINDIKCRTETANCKWRDMVRARGRCRSLVGIGDIRTARSSCLHRALRILGKQLQ